MSTHHESQHANVLTKKQEQRSQPPSLYKVALLNDDYTPMEFVVMVIQNYFNKNFEAATQIMLNVHQEGKGVCGLYSKDIAATKIEQVMEHAIQSGHPLQCVMEKI